MKISIQSSGITDVLGYKEGFAAIKKAKFNAVDFGLNVFPLSFFEEEEKLFDYFEEVKFYAKLNDIEFGQFHAPFPSYYYNDETASNRAFEAQIEPLKLL